MKRAVCVTGSLAIAFGILQSTGSQSTGLRLTVPQVVQASYGLRFSLWRPSLAQAAEVKTRKKTFVPPNPPDNMSAPGNRNSTGSRGEEAQQQLTEQWVALVPTFEREIDALKISQVWLLTASTHPTFWFHLPPSDASQAQFVIEQRQQSSGRKRYTTLYQQQIALTQDGLIAVTLPQSFAGLNPGQRYRWSLRLPASASPRQRQQLKPIRGWVEFQPLSSPLAAQLKVASPIEAVQLYGQQGRWLDSLTVMADLYRANPAQYGEDWHNLLAEIGLGELAQRPLLDQQLEDQAEDKRLKV